MNAFDESECLTLYLAVTRKRKREQQKSARESRLTPALQKLGLKRRADSTLCDGYIEGNLLYWTADLVAEKMAQMKVSLPLLDQRRTEC